MLHRLVEIDRRRDLVLIVYTYSELTENISGHFVENWSEKEKWYLSNLTLSAKLPLDAVEICDRSKVMRSSSKDTKVKDTFADISGTRYFRSNTDSSTDFTTRLVSKGSIDS